MKELIPPLGVRGLKIKLLLTDCDGVLTDGSVFYGIEGEVFKRFNIRDGMGVERLHNLVNVETGIITGELSPSVKKRAEKLNISELHLGIKDKVKVLEEILVRKNLDPDEVAYIGDDVNDLEIMALVGLSACPSDAMNFVKQKADFICGKKGGNGCFRELAELIIKAKMDL
jgi:3-deoxy-D-manno-octulosonate 8-phosphate phosphatase (KDO 8-P phosphatase)